MPQPIAQETHDEFIVRCHEELAGEYPETDQRNAVCFRLWREAKGSESVERKAVEHFSRDGFELHRDRPIFAEHTTKDRDGNLVVYDRAALQAIKDRCNKRISDTGDFAALTEGHTPEDSEAVMPKVLGYVGPYRLGMIGNEKPRWAIFADEWHDPADKEKLRRLRRRSPEVWLEDRMQDRFFDPVAALGAEAPRLDLGMRYCRTADGRTVEKYTAVAPSPASVFVPGHGDDDQPDKYDAESNTMVGPEDIQKIIEALLQTEPMKFVLAQMEEQQGAGDVIDDTPPADVPLDAPVDETPPVDDTPPAPAEDDEDKAMMSRYMAGEADEEELQQYRAGKQARYSKRNQEAAVDRERYQKLEADNRTLKTSQRKLESELAELRKSHDQIVAEKRRAERYSKLSELRQDRAFDLEEEVEFVKDMDDQQFERHLSCVEKYQRIGVGTQLYVEPERRRESEADRERYSKAAVDLVQRERTAGRDMSYETALEQVRTKAG